jgi:hypothetical protein
MKFNFTIEELEKYIKYLDEQNNVDHKPQFYYNESLEDLIVFLKSIENNCKGE